MRLRVGVKLFRCRAIRGLICYWCERRGEPLQRGCVKNDPRENCDPREKSREQEIQLKWNSSEFQRLHACYLVKINKSFFLVVVFFLFYFNLYFISQFILQTPFLYTFFSLSQCLASLQSLPQLWCVWVCAASICEMCVHHSRRWVA